MKKKSIIPSYQSIMPNVIYAIKSLDGSASSRQVLYKVLLDLDIALSDIKKAKNSVDWAGVYLRKLEFLENDSPKGIWILKDEYKEMGYSEIRDLVKQRYKNYYKL